MIAGLIVGALVLAGCGPSVPRGKPDEDGVITLRFAHEIPTSHVITVNALEPWMEEVVARTNGKVQFEYYPAGQLVEAGDIFSAMKSGVIDVGFFVPANAAAAELPLADVTAVPGFGGDTDLRSMQDAYWDLLDGILGEKDYLPKNVRPLMGILAGKYQLIAAEEPVRTLDDWKGMTVRSAGGVSDFVISNLGAAPVHMGSGEVYEGMQRGTIEGAMYTLESIPTASLEDVTKSATTNAPFGGGPTVLAIQDEVWQKLPKDVQVVMEEARVAALNNISEFYENESMEKIVELSSQIDYYQLTDEELAALEPAMIKSQNQWVAQRQGPDKPAREVLDEWIAALERHSR